MTVKEKKIAAKTKATVETIVKEGSVVLQETHVEEDLGTKHFPDFPATVVYKHGETINKGNFESARIDVGIYMPCEVNDVDVTFETAIKWVEERLRVAIETSNNGSKESSKNHPF